MNGHDTYLEESGVKDFTLPKELAIEEPQAINDNHDTLKYHLLGPSLTKAGQDSVDQTKVRKPVALGKHCTINNKCS